MLKRLVLAFTAAAVAAAGFIVPTSAAVAAPEAPGEVWVSAHSRGIVELQWLAASGADESYTVYSGSAPEELAPIDTVAFTTTTYRHLGVTPGAKLYYAVSATGGGEEGPLSTVISHTVVKQAIVYTDYNLDSGQSRILSAPATPDATYKWVKGSQPVELRSSESDYFYDLTVSPQGDVVAYTTQRADFSERVEVQAIDGTEGPRVLADAGEYNYGPTWSPDGARVAFTSSTFGPDYLYTVSATESEEPTQVVGSVGLSDPSWTIDGKSLIATDYDRYSGGADALVSINVSQGARTYLNGTVFTDQPAASPNGASIAAVRDPDGEGFEAWTVVLPLGGGSAKRVSTDGLAGQGPDNFAFGDYSPAWTLDSSRVFFSQVGIVGNDLSGVVASVAPNGTGQVTPLAYPGIIEESPSFASADTVGPVVKLTAPSASVTTSGQAAVWWNGVDPGGSGIKTYELKWSRITPSGVTQALSAPASWKAMTGRTVTATLPPNYQYCFSVRAKDNAGNLGAWSGQKCIATPVDESLMSRSSGWQALSGSAYFNGKAQMSTKKGATLTRTGVKAKQIGAVIRTCSTCGPITVYMGSTKVGTIYSKAKTSTYKKVSWLPAFTSQRTGTVKFVAASGDKVIVDGLLVR